MTNTEKRLEKIWESIEARVPFRPDIALVLGSGLGEFADQETVIAEIPFSEIDDFPISSAPGHIGKFLFAKIGNASVVMMQGRIHYYEGYAMEDVVLPARLMRKMGASVLFLTNAAGGIDPSFAPGTLMLITDQIANFVPSPLIGPNLESIGTRFPDMSEIYDRELCGIIREQSTALDVPVREGVYIQLSGPNYETPAEVRMCRLLGADAVGMSTAVEAIAGRHAGFRICGISLITNAASGLSEKELSHEEVLETAEMASVNFQKLVRGCITHMARKKPKNSK